jgi:hypothetical protein
VLLAPGESARFEASGSKLELLHMVTPDPPAALKARCRAGPDNSSIAGRRLALSVTPAEAVCAASAPCPPLDFSMAAGSRQPMPFKRARCTVIRPRSPPEHAAPASRLKPCLHFARLGSRCRYAGRVDLAASGETVDVLLHLPHTRALTAPHIFAPHRLAPSRADISLRSK